MNRLVTISECSSLTDDVRLDVKRCRTLSDASVIEADNLGDRSGELLECRDSCAGVHLKCWTCWTC